MNTSPTYFETLPNFADTWEPIATDQMRAELAATYPNTDETLDLMYCQKAMVKTSQAKYRRYIPETVKDWARS